MHGITDEQNYVDIANAIREKNGSDTQYLPSEMANAIGALPNPPQFGLIGWDAEDVSNYNVQLAEDIAYNKTLYDAWDANTTNMTRFYMGNNKIVYFPKIDTSNVNNMAEALANCNSLIIVPHLDTSNATNINGLYYNCKSLRTIPLIDASKVTTAGWLIDNSTEIRDIGGFKNLKVGINLSPSTNITHDSLMNVINNLYDLASNGLATQTLNLGETNLAKLTEEEKAIAVNKGWTLA